MMGNFEDIRPQQRFATGQDQYRYFKPLQILHHFKHLGGTQFVGKILVRGNRITVLAGKVAAAHEIPDYYGTGWRSLGPQGWGVNFVHELRYSKHWNKLPIRFVDLWATTV